MKAVRPVLNKQIDEPVESIEMGSMQDEYTTLPVDAVRRTLPATGTYAGTDYFVSVSRWRPTEEERALLAGGADIVHQVIHRIGNYPPMNLQVVLPPDDPQIVQPLESK